MTTAILIAAHKPAPFPTDLGYLPVHVGHAQATIEFEAQPDDEGDHISVLNDQFCELTGLYWAWHNTSHDYYGLVHYRRYFKFPGAKAPARPTDLVEMLNSADLILPRRRIYGIETVARHYGNAHHGADLACVRAVLLERHPDYLHAFDVVMGRRTLTLYNMFFTRQQIFNDYCEWLFDVLFAVQPRIDVSTYGSQQRRVFGYLGERLFNVWVEQHKDSIRVRRLPVLNTDGEPLIPKALGLIHRKFSDARVD